MATTPVRTVLAEDSLLVRRGLVELVSEAEGLEVAAAVGSFDDLLAAVEAHEPDVVVTDIRMPPTNVDEGIRAAIHLRRSHPMVGVVVISQFMGADYALSLFEHGSARRGYLLKDKVAAPEQLATAIRSVASGGSYIDADVVDALVSTRARHPSGVDKLSAREQQVLALVAVGSSNSAVAADLDVSVRAVEKHVNAIFTKLGLFDDPASHRRVSATLHYLEYVRGHMHREAS